MRRLRIIFVLLAVACWLPMTLHCELESIPGLEFLACAADEHSGDAQSHCDANCCSVERAAYKADQVRQALPAPALLPDALAVLLNANDTLSGETFSEPLESAPPDLPTTWQFVFRTAAPPRAPSLAS